MQLRDYQVSAIGKLRTLLASGISRLVLCAPTGSGKTVMASEMIRSCTALGNRSLVIAHRKELIDQTVDKLERFGVPAGVIMASDRRRDDWLPVQVGSIQTLARRLDRLPAADLVVVDECHHACSDSYRKVLERYPGVPVIGLTATPWRSDKIGLASLFDAHVLAATVAELMQSGALVQYDAYAYDAPDLHDVGTVAGEYNQKQLGLACNTGVLVGSVVREYLAHADGRPGICFPVNVAHSQSLVAEFQAAGVRAEHLDCHTPRLERERMINGLRSGAVTLLCSVGVLTEGFDAPAAEVCILARPTKSLSLHLQMIGRVLRPAPGKSRALIHDHAGNLMRHGFAEDERSYELTATPERVRELHKCPLCRAIYGVPKRDGTCPTCGQLIAPPSDTESTGPREGKQVVDGERVSADEIRARRGTVAQQATPDERKAEYLRLRDVASRKGYAKGWIGHRYRAVFGTWPSFSDADLDGVKPATVPFAIRYVR